MDPVPGSMSQMLLRVLPRYSTIPRSGLRQWNPSSLSAQQMRPVS